MLLTNKIERGIDSMRSWIGKSLLALLIIGGARATFAQVINFEAQCPTVASSGPCATEFVNAGNAQAVNISTTVGNVLVQGGILLDAATNLPADETAVYGTAGNATSIGVTTGSGFTNPITITFTQPIHNFFLTVLNGNTASVNYIVADNAGNSATFTLVPNLSGGQNVIGFAATGSVVTITAVAATGAPWDFFIDNLTFNMPLPTGLTPISTTTPTPTPTPTATPTPTPTPTPTATPTPTPTPTPTSTPTPAPSATPAPASLILVLIGIAATSLYLWRRKGVHLMLLALLLIPLTGFSAETIMHVRGVWNLTYSGTKVTLTIDRQNGKIFSGTISGDNLGGKVTGQMNGMTLVFDRAPEDNSWRQSFKLTLVPAGAGGSQIAHGSWTGYRSAGKTQSASVERIR